MKANKCGVSDLFVVQAGEMDTEQVTDVRGTVCITAKGALEVQMSVFYLLSLFCEHVFLNKHFKNRIIAHTCHK